METFSPARGHSDKDSAAVGMYEIVGQLDDAGVAGGVDHDICAGFSDDITDFLGNGELENFIGEGVAHGK